MCDESWRSCHTYLATVAFLVLGTFVFCVGCQLWGRGNSRITTPQEGQTYRVGLLGGGLLDLGLSLLDSSLDLRNLVSTKVKVPRQHCDPGRSGRRGLCRRGGTQPRRTFLTTLLSFLGAAVFLVTPVGFAPAFLVAGFLLIAGAVSTCWKTRGLELPVADRVPSRAIAN